ncbi:glycosyltransferase, partial [Patescibacteria group bacterium]|nr:glycosyltransferase [Patescibacteria group bacterium]
VDVAQHEKLDILHVHYGIPHASAAYMAQQILKTKGIELPFITTLHGTDITLVGKDESFEPIISFSINQSTAITAVSESLKQDTYKYFDTTRDIHVIPNFVNLDEYNVPECAEIKQKYAPNGERILVHTSNFREVKRIDDIIKIFAIVQKKIPAKLILVGEGPERNTLEKMAKDMDLVGHIHFL